MLTAGFAPGRRMKLWLLAIRPLTLPLSFSPVLVGASLASAAQGRLDWSLLAMTLLAASAIQAGTNLLNDAKDFERGNDTPKRKGPPRVTAQGQATAQEVTMAALTVFLFAALGGLYLVSAGGWPIFWIGLCSLLAAVAYSAGPLPLSHTPLGELFVFAFFGLVPVAGTFYLQTGSWSPVAVWSGALMGAFAAAVLHVNNSRDREEDEKAGRTTLAVVLSRHKGEEGAHQRLTLTYGLLVLVPYLLLVFMALLSSFPFPFFGGPVIWALFSLPGALMLVRLFSEARSAAESNRLLVLTIGLQLAFATLFCLGLLV